MSLPAIAALRRAKQAGPPQPWRRRALMARDRARRATRSLDAVLAATVVGGGVGLHAALLALLAEIVRIRVGTAGRAARRRLLGAMTFGRRNGRFRHAASPWHRRIRVDNPTGEPLFRRRRRPIRPKISRCS